MTIAPTRKNASAWPGFLANPKIKAVWQQMAQDWLRMIPKNAPSKPEHTEPPRQTKTEK